jgi:UDP-N-acetylglucosamine transferase subunit ALG13
MIFLTVGSQLAFDRLTKSVDAWASANPDVEVFGQIGESSYIPQHIKYATTLTPSEYQSMIDNSDIIISHVGMGTIITALDKGMPLLVLPRKAEYGEHRNNHQLATTKFVKQYELIEIAEDESEISSILDRMIAQCKSETSRPEHLNVSPELVDEINNFINS